MFVTKQNVWYIVLAYNSSVYQRNKNIIWYFIVEKGVQKFIVQTARNNRRDENKYFFVKQLSKTVFSSLDIEFSYVLYILTI